MRKVGLYWLVLLLALFSCREQSPKFVVARTSVPMDSLNLSCIADTFIADLVVKNPDSADWWTEKCVQRLQRKAFVDTIFQQLYHQQLIAYDYFSGKPLSISQIKELEHRNDFNRNIVGKFQFYEGWYYDYQKKVFLKKVYAIIFGYETYDDNGLVKGYKPMFKVVFE